MTRLPYPTIARDSIVDRRGEDIRDRQQAGTLTPLAESLEQQTNRIAATTVIVKSIVDGRQREKQMAALLEIKGLGAAVTAARSGMRDVRASAGALNAEATLLKAELDDATAQIKQARVDLKFEAQTLGNSPGSEPSFEKPKDTGA